MKNCFLPIQKMSYSMETFKNIPLQRKENKSWQNHLIPIIQNNLIFFSFQHFSFVHSGGGFDFLLFRGLTFFRNYNHTVKTFADCFFPPLIDSSSIFNPHCCSGAKSHLALFDPVTEACQASQSFTSSLSLLKLMVTYHPNKCLCQGLFNCPPHAWTSRLFLLL